jgi:Flp pilus assembly protein TadG
MAIVLPLLLLLILGVIEYGWMFLKNQGVTNVARQTARAAVRYEVTDTEIQAALSSAISAAGLGASGYTMTMNPADTSVLEPGDMLSVTVSVPYANIRLLGVPFLPTPANLSSTITMAKEGF